MFIHPKRSFVCLCLGLGLLFSAAAHAFSPVNPALAPTGDCDDPAPDNYQIADVGADFIKVTWDLPSTPPFEYNIKVFEVGSGLLVDEFDVPGTSVSAGISSLSPNTTYEIRNTPRCADGELSIFNVSDITTTLIVDLVSSGFTPPANFSNCTISSQNQFCFADPNEGYIVPFKIRQGSNGESRWFGVFGNSDACPYSTIKIRPNDDGSPFQFYCSNGEQAYCSGGKIVIKHEGVTVAEIIHIESFGEPRKLAAGFLKPGYQIARYSNVFGIPDPSEGGCGGDERSPLIQQPESPAFPEDQLMRVTPNPFNDQLQVQIPAIQNLARVALTLSDLQGRTVLTLYAPADHSTVTLPTETLTPGMYFLRADFGDRSETVKLVKMQ